MRIDFHTHTFPMRIAARAITKMQAACHAVAYTDGTEAALTTSMQRAGIDYAVVLPVATNPAKVTSMNDLSIQKNGQDRLIYFGCIHPMQTDWRQELDRIAAAGLRGIKIHPVYQGVDFDDIRYLRILERAGELGLLTLTHAGDDIGFPGVVRCNPAMIRNACRQVGKIPLILAHMGGWKNWTQVAELLADTGVYLDTAFSLGEVAPLTPDYYTKQQLQLLQETEFCQLVRCFGSERILFGTDSPWTDQAASLRQMEALPLTATEKKNILGENARRLLGAQLCPQE